MQLVGDSHEAELERLVSEHRALDTRVQELEHLVHLTGEEELELHQLKKQKLQKKDQIEQLRAQHYP